MLCCGSELRNIFDDGFRVGRCPRMKSSIAFRNVLSFLCGWDWNNCEEIIQFPLFTNSSAPGLLLERGGSFTPDFLVASERDGDSFFSTFASVILALGYNFSILLKESFTESRNKKQTYENNIIFIYL